MLKGKTDVSINLKNDLTYSLNKCRICLKCGEIYIFAVEDLLDQITEFGAVTISEDDPYPKYICEPCYALLKSALLFRQKATDSERLLYSRQATIENDVTSNNSERPTGFIELENQTTHPDTEVEKPNIKRIFYNSITKLSFFDQKSTDITDESLLNKLDLGNNEDAVSNSGSEREYLEINYDTDDSTQNVKKVTDLQNSSELNVKYDSDNSNLNENNITHLQKLPELSVNYDSDDSIRYEKNKTPLQKSSKYDSDDSIKNEEKTTHLQKSSELNVKNDSDDSTQNEKKITRLLKSSDLSVKYGSDDSTQNDEKVTHLQKSSELSVKYDSDNSTRYKNQDTHLQKSSELNVKYGSDDSTENVKTFLYLHKPSEFSVKNESNLQNISDTTNLQKPSVIYNTDESLSSNGRQGDFNDFEDSNGNAVEHNETLIKEQYYCGICNKTIESLNELELHCELQHNIKTTDKVKCDVCGEDVSVATQHVHLKKHQDFYKQKKRKVGKVECKICNKMIMKTYINYHMKIHGTATERAQRRKFCEICNKSISLHYFVSHLRRIHKLGPNGEKSELNMNCKNLFKTCPVCERRVHTLRFKEHLADHGKPPKIFICEHCAKVFTHQSSFKTHQLTHSNDFKYQCQFCPYKAQYSGLIKVHVKTHTGDYNYKCPHCPAKYTTKSNLNQHVLRHNAQGNIKCHGCDRYFFRKNNMEKHFRSTHLGIRDVDCDTCGMSFSHRDEMLSHQLRIHNRARLIKRMPNYLRVARENEKSVTE